MPTPPAENRPPFPVKSLLLFITGAVMLRVLSMTGWAFFPGDGRVGPQLARVLIPLCFAAALVVLNQRLLRRDGFPADMLGLRPTFRRAGWFVMGGLVIIPVIGILVGALWLFVPFHYERGTLSFPALIWQSAEYFGGNSGEELIFRGYLLLILVRHLGLPRALIITGFLFGLFHLPGLSGLTALKMVCTTFLGACVYAYGYVLTGTLWTAIGMHVVANIVLHHVFGASGKPSLFTPVLHEAWPASYDPAFWVWVGVFVPVVALASVTARRHGTSTDFETAAVENVPR